MLSRRLLCNNPVAGIIQVRPDWRAAVRWRRWFESARSSIVQIWRPFEAFTVLSTKTCIYRSQAGWSLSSLGRRTRHPWFPNVDLSYRQQDSSTSSQSTLNEFGPTEGEEVQTLVPFPPSYSWTVTVWSYRNARTTCKRQGRVFWSCSTIRQAESVSFNETEWQSQHHLNLQKISTCWVSATAV